MKHPGFLKTHDEVQEWINEKCIYRTDLRINNDLTVSADTVRIDLNRRLNIANPKFNSYNILVKFRSVSREFSISSSKITTLYGVPDGIYHFSINTPAPLLKTLEYLPDVSNYNISLYDMGKYLCERSTDSNRAAVYVNWLLKYSPDISHSLRYINNTDIDLFKEVISYTIENKITLPIEEDYLKIASSELIRTNHRM